MIRSAASIRPPPAGLAVLNQTPILSDTADSRLDCLRAFRRADARPALNQRRASTRANLDFDECFSFWAHFASECLSACLPTCLSSSCRLACRLSAKLPADFLPTCLPISCQIACRCPADSPAELLPTCLPTFCQIACRFPAELPADFLPNCLPMSCRLLIFCRLAYQIALDILPTPCRHLAR